MSGGRLRVGLDAGALMLSRKAPGTAKFVREQTAALLQEAVPWEWVVAVPRGMRDAFPHAPPGSVIELEGSRYSIFATMTAGRLFRSRRCAASYSPAGLSAWAPSVVANYFDSNLFEYGVSAVASRDRLRYHFMRALAKDTFRRARTVFVNSEYCATVLRRHFPHRAAKFRANPVGIAPAPAVPREPPAWAPAELSAGFILCSSAFMDNKNQRRLIEAYIVLQNAGRALPPLVLIGPCPADYLAAVIAPAIAASPAPGNIVMPGHVSDEALAWAFAHARVVVQPSFAEGFSSFSVFQAMQRGVPVACANTTSHPEAVADAAFLFDPASVPELAAAIGRLLDEPELRTRLAAAGARRVAELSWQENARRVCAEIAGIVEGAGARIG